MDELDKLKKDNRLKFRAIEAIKKINEFRENVTILDKKHYLYSSEDTILNDDCIIESVLYLNSKDENPILVTNDEMMHFKCHKKNINVEKYLKSIPFQTDSEKYTGFVNKPEEDIYNSFYWNGEGKLVYYKSKDECEIINYENEIWKIKPRTQYQNAAMTLLKNPDLDLLTIQSEAGFGKTFLALAAALYWTLEKKKYKKIMVIKPNIDVGSEKLGFLPGDIKDKTWPYFNSIYELLLKLHEIRPALRIFKEGNLEFLNERVIEFAPINFMRGRNIENSFVIIDEFQNFSRLAAKTLLSRLGENTKCVCTGDIRQIDDEHLTEENNGLNWVVKLCKNNKNYGHITLKGSKSRGPIADLVRKVKL